MGNPQVTEFELGWIVGIFDGEGSFLISRSKNRESYKYAPSIKLVNTNLSMIEEVSKILLKLQIYHTVYDAYRSGNQRPAKRLEINDREDIKKYLKFFLSRMICKLDQGMILRDFIQHREAVGRDSYSDIEYSYYLMLQKLH